MTEGTIVSASDNELDNYKAATAFWLISYRNDYEKKSNIQSKFLTENTAYS